MKHSTLLDIAKKMGVATSTVSRALNDHPNISSKIKAEAIKIAEELNYVPNTLAKNLKNNKTTTIGVIVPDIKHDFFSSAIGGAEEVAHRSGYSLIVTQSNENFEREVINAEVLLHQRVAGVIVSVSEQTINGDHFRALIKRGIPIVFFDRVLEDITVPKVIIDDYSSSFNAVSYLIKCGRKKIAHFAGQQSLLIYQKRLKGYIDALMQAGIDYNPELVLIGEYQIEHGYQSMDKFIKTGNLPDAIFAINDSLAIGASQRIKEEGLRIPEDIALVGFSNMKISSLVDPSLTTVNQPSYEMGKTAVKLLLQLINSNTALIESNQTVILDTELIIRKST